jgi:F-type H+-transporting ATPase subunit c
MKSGVASTDPNARTGLLTPPGMTFFASANNSAFIKYLLGWWQPYNTNKYSLTIFFPVTKNAPVGKKFRRRKQMKKKFVYAALSGMAVWLTSTLALAMEAAATAAPAAAGGDYTKAIVVAVSIFSAAMVMAAGTMTTALGMGHGLNGAVNAVGRNPEAQGKILTTMMVGLAMIESLAIYALVIALVVIYANPLMKGFGG